VVNGDGDELRAWKLIFSKQAQKDSLKVVSAGLKPKAEELLEVVRTNPFQSPPPYEKLIGDLAGAYSRRINVKHRLVYQIDPILKEVRILRMWSHYE